MSTATITVGMDVRAWVEYTVRDATPAELETLSQLDSDEAVQLANELAEAGRLEQVGIEYEEGCYPFEDHRAAAVIDLSTEA